MSNTNIEKALLGLPYINIHAHVNDDNDVKSTHFTLLNLDYSEFKKYSPNQFYSAGLHPWYINDGWEQEWKNVQSAANQNNVVAIGETGLDRDAAPLVAGVETDMTFHRPLAVFGNHRDIDDLGHGDLGCVLVAASKCASGEEHYGVGCGGAQGFHFQSHSVQVFSDGVKLRWPVGMLTEWAVHLPFRFEGFG